MEVIKDAKLSYLFAFELLLKRTCGETDLFLTVVT